MDIFAREVLNLEYYWGRVEFATGCGAIHLHILGIAKNKAYLPRFYCAETEDEKIKVLEDYANEFLGMTADVKIDNDHFKFYKIDKKNANHNVSSGNEVFRM